MNYYELLKVEMSASPEEIKSAFRKLAHIHHPDKGGREEDFKAINEAYQVLSDPARRRQYDFVIQPLQRRTVYYKVNFNRETCTMDGWTFTSTHGTTS